MDESCSIQAPSSSCIKKNETTEVVSQKSNFEGSPQKREFLRSLFPMDQRGVLLMDKTWRSRVFGQGRTRSGGPRLCADRSGAKNSTPFCGGGGYTVNWTLKRRKVTRKSKTPSSLATQYSIA